jgi:hypothetical protein
MSNHLARPHAAPASQRRQVIFMWTFPLLVVGFVAGVTALAYHRFGVDRSWPGYTARILESRVVPYDNRSSSYGGSIIYRAEVHAQWSENGKAYDEWVPTSLGSSDRSELQFEIASQKVCVIRRNPHDRRILTADLGDDWETAHPTVPNKVN